MTGEGLAVVLHYQTTRTQDLQTDTANELKAARETGDRLDGLDDRLNRLLAQSGTTAAQRPLQPANDGVSRPRPVDASTTSPSWDQLVEQAAASLRDRGIDPTSIDLDQLLDPDEVKRIERRHSGGFAIKAHLDPYDIIAAVGAGLVACIIDALIVRVPADTKWWTDGETLKGSALTKALRNLSIDSDNPLAEWAKVSYDKVSDLPEKVIGLGGPTHRVHTFGHDPLLGLVMGTWDIMRGTMTAVHRGGGIVSMDIKDPVNNPFVAFAKQVVHLLSDVPTRSGLPLPGWVGLTTISNGSFGPNRESIGEVARRMYLNGYDSWHLITMMTSVAALEIVLRGYWGLRGALDEKWRDDVDVERSVSGATGVSDHPRYASMALAANGVAAAGNLGKVAFMGGNPLALNYAQWLSFLRAFFKWADHRMTSATDVLTSQARVNAMAIDAGWRGLDFLDPTFPTPDVQ